MAKDTRVAGIYSEIKYKFNPKSLKDLAKFRKSIRDLKKEMDAISKIKMSPQIAAREGKTLKVAKQITKEKQKAVNLDARAARVQRERRRFEGRISSANVKPGELGRERGVFNQAASRFASGKDTAGQFALKLEKQYDRLLPKINKVKQQQKMFKKAVFLTNKEIGNSAALIGKARIKQIQMNKATLKGAKNAKAQAMSFKQLRSQFVGMIGAWTAFSGLADINRVGQDFENAGVMMKTALGDDAADAMDFLLEQSNRLGIDAAANAKGFARYAIAAKQIGFTTAEVKEQFLGVAEAATVFGLTQEQQIGTIRALEQIAS